MEQEKLISAIFEKLEKENATVVRDFDFPENNFTFDDKVIPWTPEEEEWQDIVTCVKKYLITMIAVLSLGICVLAAVTWLKIRKWRKFHNFVNINLMFSATVHSLIMVLVLWGVNNILFDNFWIFARLFSYNLFICWLFIASIDSYMKIVKVFFDNISHKRIKSTIFVVLMSSVDAGLAASNNIIIDLSSFRVLIMIAAMFMVPLLLIINFFIYVRVVCSLCRVDRLIDRKIYIQKLKVATFTFLMSGSMMLPALYMNLATWLNVELLPESAILVFGFIVDIQKLVVCVCFLLLTENQEAWQRLFKKIKNNNFV